MIRISKTMAEALGVVLYPGVRQNHLGLDYQEGRTPFGKTVYVDATDSRSFELSDGTFVQNTLHVVVTEEGGATYRAGENMVGVVHKASSRPRLPLQYYTRERGGIARFVN